MKLFRKSREALQKFKANGKIFFHDFRATQQVYFQLLFKKDRTEDEQRDFNEARKEQFRLSFFIACWLAPLPFVGTVYFFLMPRKFWPNTLKRVLNMRTYKFASLESETTKKEPLEQVTL